MECDGCPEITLGELGDELRMHLQGKRHPLGASFELTERCNLQCIHCYINQPANSRQAKAGELTRREAMRVLDELADAGCLFLLLTGGEALLRLDFEDLFRYAKKKGFLITLFTNGTLLTSRQADFLADWRPQNVEITLYGATAETYERVTGVPGSFARCMRGIDLVLHRGLRLSLKSVLLRANRRELPAMKAMAESLGVTYRFDGTLWPRLDGTQGVLDQRLAPAEVVALDEEYPERQSEYAELYKRFYPPRPRSQRVFSCGAGQLTVHVDCSGRMSLCMMARRPSYDLLRGSFDGGWGMLGAELSRQRSKPSRCTDCDVGVLCNQCPGWSQLVHGDDETPVDYICEIGRLRTAQTVAALAASPVAA